MNDGSQSSTIIRTALSGLICQIILGVSLFFLWRWSNLTAPAVAAGFAGCGAMIWLYLWLDKMFCRSPEKKEEKQPQPASSKNEDKTKGRFLLNAVKATLVLARNILNFAGKLIPSFFSLTVALLLAGGGIWFILDETRAWQSESPQGIEPLQGLALSAGLSIFAFGMSRYHIILARTTELSVLRAGAKYLAASSVMIILICISFISEHLGNSIFFKYATLTIAGFSALIGAEIILVSFLDIFRPRKKNATEHSAFDSRLLSTFIHSGYFGRTIMETLDYQFGFEVSRTWCMRVLGRSLWITVGLILSLLALLSSMVIVEPHQKAVISRFGRIKGIPLGPGLHLKAPWPVDSASLHDVTSVRRIHVGSHRPESPDGEIYQKDVPILWSNLHGISTEHLLIVAPPGDLGVTSENRTQHDTTMPPSVSLVGGDIFVEYRIKDLLCFIRHSNDTEMLFAQIAETETSRELYRFDIDTLIGFGQIEAAPRIQERIQTASDKARLGIETLKVGFTGVHPPQNVAKAFHQTIVAHQEKETAVESAQSFAIRLKTETAGSSEHADRLIAEISRTEALSSKVDKNFRHQRQEAESLLVDSGGMVAEIMADAKSYRWQRENSESGKVERFLRRYELFQISPFLFPHWQYLSTLERGLAKAKKIVLLGNRESLVLRFDFKDGGMEFYDMAESSNRFPGNINSAKDNGEFLMDRLNRQ